MLLTTIPPTPTVESWIAYALSLVIAISLISSLFVFPDFWAKTAKAYKGLYVRIPLAIWITASQVYWYAWSMTTHPGINTTFYWELCNIVAWGAWILVIFPNKFILDILLPFALIGPTFTIVTPTAETGVFAFSDFRYWQYFYGHIASLFGFIYIWMFGFTKFKFGWTSIKRSFMFAWAMLTFVELWNFMSITYDFSGKWAVEGEEVTDHFPNYIFRDVFVALGIDDKTTMLQQYFILTYGIGPGLMAVTYVIQFFVPPRYLNYGTEKQKFAINHEFLDDTKRGYNKVLKMIKR